MSTYTGGVRNRRKKALTRLQNQLSNRKPPLVDTKRFPEEAKERIDNYNRQTRRIEKEINTLTTRI